MGAKTALKRIWLSWLAFSPSAASFGSYGGQVSQTKYASSVSNDISNTLYQTPYLFYGLNLISLSSSQPLDFTSAIDDQFVLTISASSLVDDFSLVYIALGVLPGKHCLNCGNSIIANNGNCVSSCPAGSFPFTYKDGGVACRTCSKKLGLTLVNGKCVIGSTTVSTKTTTTVISAQTSTKHSASNTHGQSSSSTSSSGSSSSSGASSGSSQNAVVVPAPAVSGTTTSASSVNTNIVCPENSFYNGVECVCNVGYVYKNDKCRAADASISAPINIGKPANDASSSSSSASSQGSSSSSSSSSPSSSSSSSSESA